LAAAAARGGSGGGVATSGAIEISRCQIDNVNDSVTSTTTETRFLNCCLCLVIKARLKKQHASPYLLLLFFFFSIFFLFPHSSSRPAGAGALGRGDVHRSAMLQRPHLLTSCTPGSQVRRILTTLSFSTVAFRRNAYLMICLRA